MKNKSKIVFTLIVLLLFSISQSLKLENDKAVHEDQAKNKNPTTSVENPNSNTSCSKDFCMEKYGLLPDPFDPHCEENVTCWQQWYGFPQCKDDDIKCWRVAVGYPKNCEENDYDCWIKEYGYASCQDAQCLKDYLNYSCKYDDIECWKTKTWLPACKWNDWDCWVNDSWMQWVCDKKKGYECVSEVYQKPCKQDDEDCWRKVLALPDKDCEKDVKCFKEFYYLPDCKDDDFDCWKKLYWGPDCKKGDMDCLKKSLYIPDCSKQKDEVQCYKKWLSYPDCKLDDGKCWKDWNDSQNTISGGMFWHITYSHESSAPSHRAMSFGKMMDHKRRAMAQTHKINREFHMKRAGLMT